MSFPQMGAAQSGWAPQQPQVDTPPSEQFGLYKAFGVTAQRIAQINNMLDEALQRIHGPRPQGTSNAKNPEVPSIVSLAEALGAEITRLERLSADLVQFIG